MRSTLASEGALCAGPLHAWPWCAMGGSAGPAVGPESVYDLLPKELQLPPARELPVASMSQTSGGKVGSPPPGVVAADASSAPSRSVGGACSSFATSSGPTAYSTSVTDSKAMQVDGCSSAMGVSNPGVSDQQLTNNTAQQPQPQPTPKRHTVLYISPPPEDLLDNSRMSCQDDGCGLESEQSCSMWTEDSPSNFSNMSTSAYNDNTEVPRKSRKRNPKQRPGIKPRDGEESTMDIFDADSAKAPHYVLSQLGTESKGNSKAGNGASDVPKVAGGKKSPMLCGQYLSRSEGKDLKILVQPETQHRARYLTEGSRGSVKDRTQQGFPTVKLEGHHDPVTLQIFVGNDSGRVKPHGFYQACRVTGRNTTPCKEVDIEGTTVIEVGLDPSNSMTLAVDCVGILKLRNADVEARIGIAGSKKKSTRARLVFRVNIPRKDGSVLTLQTPSSPVLCTQPAGVPEILKKSLHSCSVKGEEEVFLIGKNFLKGTKVIFQENLSDESSWKAEAEIDMELFHQNHLIVKVPPYHDQQITAPVSVGIFVMTNAGRSHDIQQFTYTPDTSAQTLDVNVKQELSSPTQPCPFEEGAKANSSGRTLDQVNLLPSALVTPLRPNSNVKNEEAAPMELVAEKMSLPAFNTASTIGPSQATLETTMSSILGNGPFSSSAPHLAPEMEEQPLQPKYPAESRPALQAPDLVQPGSFPAASAPSQLQNSDALLQQSPQFPLREPPSREALQPDGSTAMALSQQPPPLQESSQALQQQQQLPPSSLFSSAGGVSQLQSTIQQLQAGSFQSSPGGPGGGGNSSRNLDLVQQVLEAQQQLSSVLFSGPESEDVQEQLNAEIFQQVSQIQNGVNQGMFSSPDPVHSRAEDLLPGRTEALHLETSLAGQQQAQAMETSAAMVMDMQQGLCQAPSHMPSDLFASSSSSSSSSSAGNGSIQQSPAYPPPPHLMGGLSASEDLPMQCELFSPTSVSSNEAGTPGGPQQEQQQECVAPGGPAMFPAPGSVEGKEASGPAEQMPSTVFQAMVQLQHGGESRAQVALFPSSEDMMAAVQGPGAQQPGGGLFQQGGEVLSLQAGSFLPPAAHSQPQLFHSQSPLGDPQSLAQETPGSLFHGQRAASSSEQLQQPMFHSQGSLGVVADQQAGGLFLSQGALGSSVAPEEPMPFFATPSSLSPLQGPARTEQQPPFQQPQQQTHLQGPLLAQEQHQGLFQAQVTLGPLPPSGVPPGQQGPLFQAQQHPLVALQNSASAQEHQQHQQSLRFSGQNALGSVASQKPALLFSPSPSARSGQEQQQQQSQALFHPQRGHEQFQGQSSGSSQAEPPQQGPPGLFHGSPQVQLVQGSPGAQEQPVTLFLSSASLSALRSNMGQQDLQQPPLYPPSSSSSSQGSLPNLQDGPSPAQQQQQQQQAASLFHAASAGGALSQLQNPSASSPQTAGMFLFGIQDPGCGQLLTSGPGSVSEQMMTLSQGQNEAQPSVTALLSQQMSESPQISSAMATNQNMKKIDDLLVSLQNRGSDAMAGSF